jgi:glycosyltransferase involved in cell wall biosynthesis
MTTLSILVPTLNCRRFIRSALESTAAIDDLDVEILVQDGGSSDGTLEVIAELGADGVHVVSESDSGQADALNRALARASGEWVLWLNADDVVDAAAVTRLAPELHTDNDMVYGDFALIDAEGKRFKTYIAPCNFTPGQVLERGSPVFSGSALFRRDPLVSAGGFDRTLDYCMDYELFVRLATWTKRVYRPGVLGSLRIHPDAKGSSARWSFLGEHRRVQARYREALGIPRRRIVRSNLVMAAHLGTTPIRYSRVWTRLRPERRL